VVRPFENIRVTLSPVEGDKERLLYLLSSSRTRSSGIASAVPFAERTVVAWNSEL
jgi:hypothetical protein